MSFNSWFMRTFAWMAGVPPTTVTQVQSAIPTVQALVRLSQQANPTVKKIEKWWVKARPIIDEGIPLLNEAQPYIKQAVPLVEKAWDEWQDIAPAIYALLDSLRQQQLAGVQRATAANNIANTLSMKYGVKKDD